MFVSESELTPKSAPVRVKAYRVSKLAGRKVRQAGVAVPGCTPVRCTPLSRQQKGIFISGLASLLEIDLRGCLIGEGLVQPPVITEVQIRAETGFGLTG